MQSVSKQSTDKLFTYKLCCPGDAVFNQCNSLSANNKQMEHKDVVPDLCHFGLLDLWQGIKPCLDR